MDKLTDYEWRLVDIANHAKVKGTFKKRIKWVEKYMHKLESMRDDPLYLSSVNALRTNQEDFPVRVDASASGLACIAILTHCKQSLKLNGLLNNGYQDVYTNIYNLTNFKESFTRDKVKKAIMTSCYGSKATPLSLFKTEENLGHYYETLMNHVPGVYQFIDYTINKLWNPDAYSYNYRMPDGYKVKAKVISYREEYVNINGKNYPVLSKVNEPTPTGRLIPSMITHSTDSLIARELTYRCNYDKELIKYVTKILYTQFSHSEVYNTEDNEVVAQIWNDYLDSGFLSAKILYHINGANINLIDRTKILELIQSLPNKPFYILPLHDEFACRANYVNDMRTQYNSILRDIWNSNLLAHIINQFTHLEPLKKDSITSEHRNIGDKIFNSNYTIN